MISFFLGVLYAGGSLALFAGLLALVVARGTRASNEIAKRPTRVTPRYWGEK